MFCGKWPERAIILAIELDEDVVPDFKDVRVILID
jgi:hypothetical protein